MFNNKRFLRDVSESCNLYNKYIDIRNLKNSIGVYIYGKPAFKYVKKNDCSYYQVECEYVENPSMYSPGFTIKEQKSGNDTKEYYIFLDDALFRYDTFTSTLMPYMCRRFYDLASTDIFGCCSLFIACSDARECFRLGNPEYSGCLYRKNLEKGLIFYGVNSILDSET